MGNFGVGKKSEEVGDYIPGKGYVSYRKKGKNDAPPAPSSPPEAAKKATPNPNAVSDAIDRIFKTVPRNRLKEAGIED